MAAAFGLVLDPWQQLVLREGLKERIPCENCRMRPASCCYWMDAPMGPRLMWAANEVGLMVSRQNGKNSTLEALELAALLLFNERLVLHCLDVHTPVLTRDAGWKNIVDLTPEDYVFHPSGKAIRVVGKSPVWADRECYRVVTTDGREVITDAGHLWTVADKRHPKSQGSRGAVRQSPKFVDMTTREMFDLGTELRADGSGCRFTLPRQSAVELSEKELPLDPYVLGAWLGDGTSGGATLVSDESDIPHWREEFAKCGVETTQHAHPNHIGLVGGVWNSLKELGLLRNKHIPEDYLLGSSRQREALLQGLMDTDGTASGGRASFTNANKSLADGVLFLARSLGWRATVDVTEPRQREGSYNSVQTLYRVKWTPKSDDEFMPFRMPRKSNLIEPFSGKQKDRRFTVSIASIERVDSRPVSCIRVDSGDGLFLAGAGLMVTHNTAQEAKTSKEAMRRLAELFEAHGAENGVQFKTTTSNGMEGIELTGGSNAGARVMFQTRTNKAGLGLSADRVIYDEAMFIAPEAVQVLEYTTSARPNSQTWYTGSAVDQRIHSGCEVFSAVRARALKGSASRLCYFEWSAPEDADPSLPEPRAMANPALGGRITHEQVQSEFERNVARGTLRAFGVQRLGIGDWPELGETRSEIPKDKWLTFKNVSPTLAGNNVVALYRAPEGGPWAIAGAQRTIDGKIHLEVGYAGDDPADSVADKFVQVAAAWGSAATIVGRGGADAATPKLEKAGLAPITPGLMEEAQACGGLLDDVFAIAPSLSHGNRANLNTAVSSAVKKELPSGGFVWENVSENTYPLLMAATLARWGLVKYGGLPAPDSLVATPPSDDELNSWLSESLDDWLNE